MSDDINNLSLPWTGERYVPEIEGQIELEHLHRYLFAAKFVQGKNVLDIASGEGYGSAILASKANYVIGVDISEEAVNHARSKYQNTNIEFRVGPADSIPVESSSIDVVVSFETIEHHDKHEEMMSEIKRVLKPDGILIMSSPDKYFYSVVPNYSNPYHVKELFKEEFKELLGKFFKNVRLLGQRVVYGSVIVPEEGTQFIFQNLTPEREEAGLCQTIYDIAVASDSDLPVLTGGLFEKKVFNQDVPDLLNYLASCERALAERDKQIADINQELREKNEQIAKLRQALVERDKQIADINQELSEKNEQIAELNQALVKRDIQIAKLNLATLPYDEQISALNQAIAERDKQIYELNQAIAGRDIEISRLANNIEVIYRSRSWRLTAPLRRITTKIRRFVQPKPRWGIGSQLIAGVLTLPATFYFYKGLRGWLKALVGGKEFFSKVLDCPPGVFNRLRQSPRLTRLTVMIPLLLAWIIRNNAGVMPAFYEVYKAMRQDGLGGTRWWLSRLYSEMVTRVNVSNIAATDGVPDPKRILVMDYRIPRADISAGELATEGILRDLCAFGFDVAFLPNDMLPSQKYEDRLKSFGVKVVTNESGYQSPGQYIAENGNHFAYFYLIRVDVAESVLDVIRRASPLAKVIFHAPDVYFLREKREAELRGSKELMIKAEQMRMRELFVMEKVDHIVVVSEVEKGLLEQYIPAEKISVFNVLYVPVIDNPKTLDGRNHIFFLGGYAHRPNVDAVHWFVSEIWPLVRKELPDTEFHILGAEAPDSVRELDKLPGVRFIGFVENLDDVLPNYKLGVAPLRYGAGIKGKVAMTMGAGIPCVCTSVAAEGMGIQDGIHALLADEPEAFAAAVIRLMTDNELWESISSSGRRFVRQRFSEEANRLSFLGVLNEARVLPLQLYIDYCRGIAPEPVPAVPTGKQVDVSIIIPVYNQWAMTAACINSVIMDIKRCHDISCEIILADDGSSDETVKASETYPGLRVVKTSKNVGFLRNCNNAAKHAKGRYLLLLNNDTIVLPGWLSSLFNTIENDPTVAIVGSKLLYPDGTIQEAGGLIFSDGTCWNVGRSYSRDNPFFNIERETDYISAASILVRKSFWNQVGGFDERYKTAYCEDSDLAMSARALGMRVVYQPASEVVHFEGQSYTEQNWSLQRHNTKLLLEKWYRVLESKHLPPTTPWYRAASNAERSVTRRSEDRRRQGKWNVLFFTPFPSHPVNHGNRATINHFAQLIKQNGCKVHFVLLQSDQYTDSDLEDMRAAWDSLDVIPYSNSKPLAPDGNTVLFDGWYEEGIGEHIRYLCAKYDIDVVWCSYIFHSKLLEYVPDYVLKVIDTHDKMGNRFEMLKNNGIPMEFFSCTPEDEGAYLRRADIVVARREEEAQYFNQVSGLNTAIVVAHIEEPQFVDKEFKHIKNVGVVASANQINLIMVDNFVKTIEKQLQGRVCPFKVHVAGQVKDMIMRLPVSKRTIYDVPWLHLHGFVDDIGAFYRQMDIICSPVTVGTGINVKTVQAMAYGMPLLATSCSIKGIETGDPLHEHTDMDDLVKSLFHLVDHPEELQRLAAVSRERFERFYEDNMNNFRSIFNHPKLLVQSGNSDRITHSDEE